MFPESNKEDDRLSKENLRLISAVEELSILNDLATAIASTQYLDQIINLIPKKCFNHIKSEQALIQLVDEKDFVNSFYPMLRERILLR
jgi:predicted SPOUT superfamily RNA methylase MTH1